MASEAEDFLDLAGADHLEVIHNAYLVRSRVVQRRILTLLAQWQLTGDRRHRDGVLAHVEVMARWEYWSTIAARRGDDRPDAIFDLSYGENSATLAMVFDLLHDDLDAGERDRLVTLARDRALDPFLAVVEREEAWWLGRHDTNWNSVCVGGAGMLALAMADELPERAEAVLPVVERSLEPFMQSLVDTAGGWPEGIGYWAYGMRYAFQYLLSHEQATGGPHALLRAEATRQSVEFPLDFWPHGQACSFGDSNHFALAPVHVRVAELLDCRDVLSAVRPLIDQGAFEVEYEWRGHAAEALLLGLDLDQLAAPTTTDAPELTGTSAAAVRSYPEIGWTRLADRWPNPSFYLSIRGGLSGVPHGHRDLLSFHAVVGSEQLIENLTPSEYLDTTFGPRREELFEMGPQSKNVPLINGVGVINDVRADPVHLDIDGHPAVRLDGTVAMGVAQHDVPLAQHCSRTFISLGAAGVAIVDQIRLTHPGRVETRLHTKGSVTTRGATATIAGDREQLRVAHAAWTPLGLEFGLDTTRTIPTSPGDEATVLRWRGPREQDVDHLLVTLLAPGEGAAAVRVVEVTDAVAELSVETGSWSGTLRVPVPAHA